jgi:hypothetical protein
MPPPFSSPGFYGKAFPFANRNRHVSNMELPRRLTSALHTLSAAVDRLEVAVARATAGAGEGSASEQELAELRGRCAELTLARAADASRAAELLRANHEVEATLERVAASLKAIAARPDRSSSAQSECG